MLKNFNFIEKKQMKLNKGLKYNKITKLKSN